MHRHTTHDQTDALRAERGDSAAESEVLSSRFGGKERYLDDGDIERVCSGIEGYFERGPDTVVQTTTNARGFDIVLRKHFYYMLRDWEGARIRIFLLVVVRWEAVETEFLSTKCTGKCFEYGKKYS